MSFFKILIILIFGFLSFSVSYADNHSEVVEKAKDVIKDLENNVDDEEVPLNDPFAGNSSLGSGSGTSIVSTGQTGEREEMSLYNFKLVGVISGSYESYVSLVNASGEIITLQLHEELSDGVKLVDMTLNEAVFQKADGTYMTINFKNKIKETDEF